MLYLHADGLVLDHAGTSGLLIPDRIDRPKDIARMARSTSPTPASWEMCGREWRVIGSRLRAASPEVIVRFAPREQSGFAALNVRVLELQRRQAELRLALDRATSAELDAVDLAHRYQSLVKSSPSPTARVNDGMVMTELNGAFAEMLDLSEAMLLGRSPLELAAFDKEGLETLTDATARCLSDGRPVEVASVAFDIDGSRRWVDLHMVPEWAMHSSGTASVLIIGFDVTRRVLNEHELAALATTDALTTLLNRRAFDDRLAHAISRLNRCSEGLAVLFIDLDNFKLVNDGAGHLAGDEILRRTAERLRTTSRMGDTVARVGGDEFAVIANEITDPAQALELAERTQVVVGAPPPEGEHPTTASIGVVYLDAPADPAAVVRDADTAMYEAKRRGRARVVLFAPTIRRHARERVQMSAELRTALIDDQFRLAYQPIVNLATGRVQGVEALIRWQHPDKGLLLPARFLAMAEELDLLGPIGTWVTSKALRQLADWRRQSVVPDDFEMNINVAPAQLRDDEYLTQLMTLLEQSRLPRSVVRLEITGQMLLADHDGTSSSLVHLADLGVRLALDAVTGGFSTFYESGATGN